MAEPEAHNVSSTSDGSSGTSESPLQLNIKTLDSRIYSVNVDKNIPIAAFKEKIASQSGVPVVQQRLIFRGKVLKDDHLLSDYNVENGDTLHLVERQPHPASGSITGEATSSNGSRGNDPNAGGQRNRIGPIAHSFVLGTLNVGDQGEAAVPDISRVIGAVLNTIGISNQTGGMMPGVPLSHVNQAEGSRVNSGSQSQDGNQSSPSQPSNGLSASHTMQIPLGAAIATPSMNMPIPDSLTTLMEFMNRMEHAFSQNGNQPNQPTTTTGDLPAVELPSNSLGLPTVEALSIVLQHAQRLLSDHAVPALIHTAGRLSQEGGNNDPAVRGQVHTESVQLGMAMQHLGALLLELGRTILTLRMGQSSAESFVNAGPAVYISPSGPNPIMVQPFPHQASSLFGASSGVSSNPVHMGTVGASSIPRNVSIHIHTGAALAPMVSGARVPIPEGMRGERPNVTETGDTVQAMGLSGITANTVPSQSGMVSISGARQPGSNVSQPTESSSTLLTDVGAQLRRLVGDMHNPDPTVSGQTLVSTNQEQHVGDSATDEDRTRQNALAAEANSNLTHVALTDDQKGQNGAHQPDIEKTVDVNSSGESSSSAAQKISSASNMSDDNKDSSSAAPLGLGLGGLQPKKRKQPKAQAKGGHSASTTSEIQQSRAIGQEVLRSLSSLSNTGNTNLQPSVHSGDLNRGAGLSVPTRQNTTDQGDVANAMSQILDSPALDGLLSGVSQQTGIGSPDMLRNMLQQFTQNPAMRNTVNQIAQQVDSHDLGSMFSGMGRGPGGGIDLGRMMQQMMPIVSQALGGVSPVSQSAPLSEQILSRGTVPIDNNTQGINLRQVVRMLEEQRPSSQEIFNSLVDSALDLFTDGPSRESIVNALCSQGHLAQEFMEMLQNDISRRFRDETGS
ncbi:ubiquitin-like domain-containing protein CIP73 isoform X2 [Andrographis paniculata]|uniref:ubiquitin-like domain-containing protein CIP73 isoform X2 n=1 Tax=Andrographis paniculata TaxID=175694 RepID=UPI0021E8F743|nr:ubiquitin-like domain-containing protein CIP73 isoform X2 [Andrographis paniculata]